MFSWLARRLTLARISISVTPAVSSIQIGALLTSATPRTSFGQSSALTLPLLKACAGMRVVCEMSLCTSCSLLISREKMATGIFFSPEACQIALRAMAVLWTQMSCAMKLDPMVTNGLDRDDLIPQEIQTSDLQQLLVREDFSVAFETVSMQATTCMRVISGVLAPLRNLTRPASQLRKTQTALRSNLAYYLPHLARGMTVIGTSPR